MILKAALIIYTLGSGATEGEYTKSTGISVVTFNTMEQCIQTKKEVKNVWEAWYSGEDETNIIQVKNTMKCIELKQPITQPNSPVIAQPKTEHRQRWND